MNRFIAIVALLSFAAFGDDTSPVTKTRLGSLNPREGLVVTGVNFSTNNEALVETIETIGGRATAPDLSALTNYTDYVAQHIRTNENLRSFVKEDGTVYHWITDGIWSTVNLHGNGWDDSYLAGARLYLWWENGVTNWTWYITGGPMAQSRTIAAAADAEVLQFKYSNGKTNVFVRGGALMYAENVGGMVSSRFNAPGGMTTNDVRNIVTNEVAVQDSLWTIWTNGVVLVTGIGANNIYWDQGEGTWTIIGINLPDGNIFSARYGYIDAPYNAVTMEAPSVISSALDDLWSGVAQFTRETKNALGLARLVDLPPLTNSLATVAISGSYNDLSDKPTIPAAITIDATLDETSANPVQNRVVADRFSEVAYQMSLKASHDSVLLTPIYQFSEWKYYDANGDDITDQMEGVFSIRFQPDNPAVPSGYGYWQVVHLSDDEVWDRSRGAWDDIAVYFAYGYGIRTIERTRTVVGYTLGDQTDKALASTSSVATASAAVAQDATNYTDSAIASADTTYTRFAISAPTNVNQSVQYINITDENPSVLSVVIPEGTGTKDWLIYVMSQTNVTISLPAATWWMADVAYTNDIAPATPTALYFSQIDTGLYLFSRQELAPVTISAP